MAWSLGIVVTILLLLAVGRLVPVNPQLAAALAVVVFAFGTTLVDATLLPVVAMPLLLVSVRVPAGGVDLSASDLALFAVFWPALLLCKRPFTPPMRNMLWLVAGYQVATLFAVVANPYLANVVEWLHAGLLAGGALVVGWAIGRAGRGSAALTLLLLAACFIAASTVIQGLRHLGGALEAVYPVFPFPMHKNFAGTVLGIAAIVAYVHPVWMRWRRGWALAAFSLCSAGVLFTQSRQAIIGLGVALAVVVLRSDRTRRRSKLIIVAVVPALVFVGTVVRDQVATGNKFNPVFQRLTWFSDSMDVWQTDPLFGVGLRWWYTDRFPVKFQPPNAEMEVLTSAGVVGLVGFIILMVGALIVLWRIDPVYGTLAVAVVLSRFVQGQFDIFWVAGQVSVPFVIAGICLGAQACDRRASEQHVAVVRGRPALV